MNQLAHIFLLLLVCATAHADAYLSAGASYREGSKQVSAGVLSRVTDQLKIGIEMEFTDCGKQPSPHDNINRMLSMSLVAVSDVNEKYSVFGKFGANSTMFSHNGENDYKADESFKGVNAAAGMLYKINDRVSAYIQATVFQYQQANNKNFGGYTTVFGGLRYDWGE